VLASLRDLQEDGEPDLVRQLVALFLQGAEPRLVALREATVQGDAATLAREAHTLKGSCASLGAIGMARICEELEALGHQGALTPVLAMVDRLYAEYHRVRAALSGELAAA
jgi:HPt (histidine-containing phosphotransfer) domain-containing protein